MRGPFFNRVPKVEFSRYLSHARDGLDGGGEERGSICMLTKTFSHALGRVDQEGEGQGHGRRKYESATVSLREEDEMK